jgi:hypothetical protein
MQMSMLRISSPSGYHISPPPPARTIYVYLPLYVCPPPPLESSYSFVIVTYYKNRVDIVTKKLEPAIINSIVDITITKL